MTIENSDLEESEGVQAVIPLIDTASGSDDQDRPGEIVLGVEMTENTALK